MQEPILYDPDRPLAHYERAQKLKKRTDRILNNGKIVSVAAFAVGTICVIYNPAMMAMMALFGLLFCIISAMGCWLKRPVMNLISIPLGITAALAAGFSGSALAPIGAAVFLLAAGWEVFSINASADFYKLKELPGFPFFDPAMDNITFAAKDRFGSDKYIDSSVMHEEKEHIKLLPTEEPSDKMEELSAVIPEEETAEPDLPESGVSGNGKIWDEEPLRGKNEVSDIDLFA